MQSKAKVKAMKKQRFEIDQNYIQRATAVDAPETEFNPKRLIKTESDYKVPLSLTITSAFFVALAVTAAPLLILHLINKLWLKWNVSFWSIVWYAFVLFIIVFVSLLPVFWFYYEKRTHNTIWALEQILKHDLNNDSIIGNPGRFSPVPGRVVPVTKKLSGKDVTHESLFMKTSEIDDMYWQTFAVLVLCRRVGIARDKIVKASYESDMHAYPNISQPTYNKMFSEIKHLLFDDNRLGKTGFDWLVKFVPDNERVTLVQPNHDPALPQQG